VERYAEHHILFPANMAVQPGLGGLLT